MTKKDNEDDRRRWRRWLLLLLLLLLLIGFLIWMIWLWTNPTPAPVKPAHHPVSTTRPTTATTLPVVTTTQPATTTEPTMIPLKPTAQSVKPVTTTTRPKAVAPRPTTTTTLPPTAHCSQSPLPGDCVPGAPQNVVGVPGDQAATLSWSAAAPNKGPTVLTYTVANGTLPVSCAGGVVGTTCRLTGLTNGQTYNLTITAHSSIATGPPSASVAVVPRTVPTAPTGADAVTATAPYPYGGAPGPPVVWPGGQVVVSWSGSASDGSPVTGYLATDGAGHTCSTTGALTCTVSGLTNGTQYTFTVTATSAAGSSPSSNSASATPIGALGVTPNVHVTTFSSDLPSPPGAIASGNATSGFYNATVTWDAPATNGATIAGYSAGADLGQYGWCSPIAANGQLICYLYLVPTDTHTVKVEALATVDALGSYATVTVLPFARAG